MRVRFDSPIGQNLAEYGVRRGLTTSRMEPGVVAPQDARCSRRAVSSQLEPARRRDRLKCVTIMIRPAWLDTGISQQRFADIKAEDNLSSGLGHTSSPLKELAQQTRLLFAH